MGLGAAKHHEGSRSLTGIGVLPQINKGQGMPASEIYEPCVWGAARELLRAVPGAWGGCSVSQVQALSMGLSPLHCEAAQPQRWLSAPLTGSGQGETLSLMGLLWYAQGKGAGLGSGDLGPSLGISSLCETDLGSQVDERRSHFACKEGRER